VFFVTYSRLAIHSVYGAPANPRGVCHLMWFEFVVGFLVLAPRGSPPATPVSPLFKGAVSRSLSKFKLRELSAN